MKACKINNFNSIQQRYLLDNSFAFQFCLLFSNERIFSLFQSSSPISFNNWVRNSYKRKTSNDVIEGNANSHKNWMSHKLLATQEIFLSSQNGDPDSREYFCHKIPHCGTQWRDLLLTLRGKTPLLLSMVLLRALWFLPTIPLPGRGFPPAEWW